MIEPKPRLYEVRKYQDLPGPPSQYGFRRADSPDEALTLAESMVEDGYRLKIREYEISGIPGLPPIRRDRYLTLDELREEVKG